MNDGNMEDSNPGEAGKAALIHYLKITFSIGFGYLFL